MFLFQWFLTLFRYYFLALFFLFLEMFVDLRLVICLGSCTLNDLATFFFSLFSQ